MENQEVRGVLYTLTPALQCHGAFTLWRGKKGRNIIALSFLSSAELPDAIASWSTILGVIWGRLEQIQNIRDAGRTYYPDADKGRLWKIEAAGKKPSVQLNMLAEGCFVPMACLLFMHAEKLMVRMCSCTFGMFHVFIINLMWLNFVIFYLRMPSASD